ncbi:oleate hydratase [Streptococcus mutans]|uniref:oleate hydratase n=1 Tax=Streptococcus mutans TaxID=1309 RepID=UPI0002B59C38|nr:oleate hydratase [Streptococcus mutans]EMC03113.1 myosin-cross-reactive antigen [Streptococcus mutans NFSM1]MCB4948633.1 oleate hydratase [Streptococcus mutans]MCB4959605.1 oleate hydratase [Streptococcus mutans]MCB5000881.1 oleate hydratase [Streptococcus mutans]MDE8030906.1 oleate hydratase [Streptococcus mutans]
MYYSSGNYEAFARPRKPAGVGHKSAYIIGSGLAALSAACFLVRDGQMSGKQVHILEKDLIPGGACDGYQYSDIGYVMRGGREMDNHFECMWDLFRSIPSIETEGISVLDEYYWLNKADPNYSLCRATKKQGQDAHTDKKFTLSDKGAKEIMLLFFTPDEDLYNKRINEVFDGEVFDSNFWLYWRTMFAFENWHSALEMKLYLKRFIHHISGLPDFTALRFTKYNQYESMILPMIKYLESFGVVFHYNTKVVNITFDIQKDKKAAKSIAVIRDGQGEKIDLTENDLVFITNGGCVENSSYGSQDKAAVFNCEIREGGGWDMWRQIAKQDPSFGHPDKFCYDPEQTNWMSATVTTLDDKIPPYIQEICKRDPFSGKIVTGGIVTVRDSNWLMSWTINRQPQFHNQPKDQLVVWVYALFSDKEGDYIKKPMRDCTGKEICAEWLYHLGVPLSEIDEMAKKSAKTVPCMMPYITAFFMPREEGDRPDVVPQGAVNFAFLGQFAQTKRDTIFTTEYSIRTGMEAVYTLLNVDRGVPEVWGSTYDIRDLLHAAVALRDGKKITDMKLNLSEKIALKELLKKTKGTDLEKLLKDYHLV